MAERRSSRISAKRSPAEWAVRCGLALFAVVAAGLSGAQSLAYVLAPSDPARAHDMAPHDARIAALFARQLSGLEGSPADRMKADSIARAALRRDPTVVGAVATLGLNAQIRGDMTTARRLFAYSDRLSRRDLMTRLWLIEDAVGRNDIVGALRQYDIALRTAKEAPELLYPVLASASYDPAIERRLAHTLAGRPLWAEGFIGFLAANTTDPVATARLFRALGTAHVDIPEAANAAVVKALVTNGHVDDAWTHYAAIRPGVRRDRSRDPRFTGAPLSPTLFDWQPVSGDNGLTATIERDDRGGVFDFTTGSSAGGAVLQQVQILPAGTYLLEGHSVGLEQTKGTGPYWRLTCADGREVWRLELPKSAERDGNFGSRFTFGGDCPVQYLQLVVRPSSIMSGASGQIDRVLLHRVE